MRVGLGIACSVWTDVYRSVSPDRMGTAFHLARPDLASTEADSV